MPRGVAVGLELVFALVEAGQRLHQESELRHYDREQDQRHCGGRRAHVEAAVEPGLVHDPAQQPE